MRIVVGAPVAERAWILPEWIDAIRSQEFDEPTQLEIVCVYTESQDDTLKILDQARVDVVHSPQPTREPERMHAHLWSEQLGEYRYMAELRNQLRNEALRRNADWFFSLDTDILLPFSYAIDYLIRISAEFDAVAPLVNMEKDLDEPAYNFMRFGERGVERYTPEFPIPIPLATDAIMAAMLLNKKAQFVPWKNHPLGEDIGWSLSARRMDVRVGVDLSIECEHRMHRG